MRVTGFGKAKSVPTILTVSITGGELSTEACYVAGTSAGIHFSCNYKNRSRESSRRFHGDEGTDR